MRVSILLSLLVVLLLALASSPSHAAETENFEAVASDMAQTAAQVEQELELMEGDLSEENEEETPLEEEEEPLSFLGE